MYVSHFNKIKLKSSRISNIHISLQNKNTHKNYGNTKPNNFKMKQPIKTSYLLLIFFVFFLSIKERERERGKTRKE
jgi:hypothetical protein